MTLPNGDSVSFEYDTLNGLHDDRPNRVSRVKLGTTTLASYDYQGLATLIGTEHPEPELLYTRYNTSGTIDRLDRFNRRATTLPSPPNLRASGSKRGTPRGDLSS